MVAKHTSAEPSPAHRAAFDPQRCYRVLIVDHVGLAHSAQGEPQTTAVCAHIVAQGGQFHLGPIPADAGPGVHFSYQPGLYQAHELRACAGGGQFDAVIAAATAIPEDCLFSEGGVRIGAGTGNMGSRSWGGGAGIGGGAPLMNTPSFNSQATAQMAFKALLQTLPDLPLQTLHAHVLARDFDTGRDLVSYPTAMLAGQRLAVLGFGNIGRSVAHLGAAYGMQVTVYARPGQRRWIEAAGFAYAATPAAAATASNVLSVHLGLGANNSNVGLVDGPVLEALQHNAVVLNFDRGELVDCAALAASMRSGRVAFAAIDADVFVDGSEVTGPLAAYLPLADEFPERTMLLPHAAADTDHPSRVAGACQAVDQILGAIRERRVVNLQGALPAGYHDGGPHLLATVGRVGVRGLSALGADSRRLQALRQDVGALAGLLAELATSASTGDGGVSSAAADNGVLAANRLFAELRALGWFNPLVESLESTAQHE